MCEIVSERSGKVRAEEGLLAGLLCSFPEEGIWQKRLVYSPSSVPVWRKEHLLLNCSVILYELAVAAAFGLVGELGMGEIKGCLPGLRHGNW